MKEVGVKEVLIDNNIVTLQNDKIVLTVNGNKTYQIVAKDNFDNISTKEVVVDNIDKVKPIITKIEGNPNNWTKENVTLIVTAEDNLSGIKDYSFDGGVTWQASNEKTFTQNIENMVIKVRDNAGNIVENGPISIRKIDKDAPVIEKVEGNPNNWTKGNVTLKVTAKDHLSGIKDYSFDGGETWSSNNQKVFTQNTENIVIKVRDNIGNISEYGPISITKIMKLDKIEIRQGPQKVEYTEGESFNNSGMRVVAIYDNKQEEEIERYTVPNGNNLKLGQESVTIRYKEGEIIKEATQRITVNERIEPEIEEYEITEENGKRYIEKIPENTTIKQVKEKIKTTGEIEVYKGSSKVTDENQIIGTGMTIKVKQNSQEITYEAVVKGDITGDGKIKMADILKLARYKAGVDKNLKGAYLKAGDVVKDGKIGMQDILKLSRVLAGIEKIK